MSALQSRYRAARRLGWLAGGLAALAFTTPSPAQFGMAGGIADAFRPAYNNRDIQLAVEMLKLDEAQSFIVRTLFEDYETEFETGVNAFKDHITAVRDTLDPKESPDPSKIMRVVFGTINEWRDESRKLSDQFTADVHDLLNEEQAALWPAFERKLFRLKFLKNGQLPGESLDLLNDVRDLELDRAAMEKLQPLLDQYELALDDALRKREDYINRSSTELIDAITQQNFDLSIGVAERQAEFRVALRDVNEQWALTLAAAMPAGSDETFLHRIRERTYPRIYRKTPAERAFESALEIEGLTPETKSAIEAQQTAFLAELASANEELVALTREYTPKELTYKVEQAARRLQNVEAQPLEDPTRGKYVARNEMSDRYVEQLRALLTPDQFASLPGARRWLSPDERAAAEAQRRATVGKELMVPDGAVPRAVSVGEGTDKPHDEEGEDDGGGDR